MTFSLASSRAIAHNSSMMHAASVTLLGVAMATAFAPLATAQCEPQRFGPDFEPRSLEFGVDVAISDEHLIVVDRFGWLYTYRRGTSGVWVFNQTLPGSSGGAVILDGDRFITGSLGVERYGGAIIYEFDGLQWSEAGRLESPDQTRYAPSGEHVALHGDHAAFANWGTRVRVHERAGGLWDFVAELAASPSMPGRTDFGNAMAMDDRFFFVGAPGENITGNQNGAVYVYEWDADGVPQLAQKLEPEPAPVGPRLGSALAVDGDTLVAGAWGNQTPDRQVIGAAYIYNYDGELWRLHQELLMPEPQNGAYFGWDVSVNGDLLVVGARGDASGPAGRGVAHLYRHGPDGVWRHAAAVAPDIGVIDYAESVDLGGGQLVVGGSESFHMGFDQGVADVYDHACLSCKPDLDADGALTIFDYLNFFHLFDEGDPQADFDGDGELTIFDFLAFQTAFDAGCD